VSKHKVIMAAVIILTVTALSCSLAQGASQVQYLSASEILNFLNRYDNERPIEQVKRELGETSKGPTVLEGDFGFATWYIARNELSIAMAYNQRTNTVKLISVAEYYADDNLRDRRFFLLIADYERIFSKPPVKKTFQEIAWDVGHGRVLSIKKERYPVSFGLEYSLGR